MPSTVKWQALVSQHLIVGPETDGGQQKSLTQALELTLAYIDINFLSLVQRWIPRMHFKLKFQN